MGFKHPHFTDVNNPLYQRASRHALGSSLCGHDQLPSKNWPCASTAWLLLPTLQIGINQRLAVDFTQYMVEAT